MTNFSSFFPVAGGGGFTKQNKYSTFRSDDADYKSGPAISASAQENKTAGANNMLFFYNGGSSTNSFTNVTNSMVGYTFTHNSTLHTITANAAFNSGNDVRFTFTPVLTASLTYGNGVSFTPPQLTVNPATDLGLADGDSIGYFMVGSGRNWRTTNFTGGDGGKIIQGSATITNASTNLVLTSGVGNNVSSTISGGLTLTTGDGIQGWGADADGGTYSSSGSSGIMGYGMGGAAYFYHGGGARATYHGYGNGQGWGSDAGDGAILLFY